MSNEWVVSSRAEEGARRLRELAIELEAALAAVPRWLNPYFGRDIPRRAARDQVQVIDSGTWRRPRAITAEQFIGAKARGLADAVGAWFRDVASARRAREEHRPVLQRVADVANALWDLSRELEGER